jgi:hypothetical protein
VNLDPLEGAQERYHAASTALEREQARIEVDAIAIDREAFRKVRAAALRRDPWMLERLAVLREELSREY